MKKAMFLVALLWIGFAMPLVATTWGADEFTCPVCAAKNQFGVINSYGGYIYRWPSRFEYIFWPLTDSFSVYSCRQCFFTCFMNDFTKIPQEKIPDIKKRLEQVKIDWSNADQYYKTSILERLLTAEQVYSVLDRDDEFWCRFYRVMGHHYAADRQEREAAAARQKALVIAQRLLTHTQEVVSRKELLVIAGAMRYHLKDTDGAIGDFVEALKLQYHKPASSEANDRKEQLDFYLTWLLADYCYQIGERCVPQLSAAIKDDQGGIRYGIADALFQLAPYDAVLVPTILQVLREGPPQARQKAAEACLFVTAIPALLETTSDQEASVRTAAVHALYRLTPDPETDENKVTSSPLFFNEVSPLLLASVRDASAQVREAAVKTLNCESPMSLYAIRAALLDEAKEIRRVAIKAIKAKISHETNADYNRKAAMKQNSNDELEAWEEKPEQKPWLVPALIQALKDMDQEVQLTAAEAIQRFHKQPTTVIPDLLAMAASSHAEVKATLLWTLRLWILRRSAGTDGRYDSLLLATALPLVQDENKAVAKAAIYLLGDMGESAFPAVPDLVSALDDKESDQELKAELEDATIYALGKIGTRAAPAIPKLIKRLSEREWESDTGQRCPAANALGYIGKAALPALLVALQSPQVNVRGYAQEALETMGTQAASAMPAVAQIKQSDADERLRKYAAEVLRDIDPQTPPDVSAKEKVARLSKLLAAVGAGDDALACLRDIFSYRQTGWILDDLAQVKGITPLLLKAIDQAHSDIPHEQAMAEQMIEVLEKMGPGAAEAVPLLTALLTNQQYRFRAIIALEHIGPAAAPATLPLVTIFQNADKYESRWAANALCEIGPAAAAAIPTLTALLQSPNLDVRRGAARVLGAIGSAAIPALPALLAVLSDTDLEVQRAVISALIKIDPKAETLVATIGHWFTAHPDRLWDVVDWLAAIETHDVTIVPILLQGLQDERMATQAAKALACMGRPAIPALLPLLDSPHRATVVLVLKNMGKPALPELFTIAEERDDVRYEAVKAIAELETDANAALPLLLELVQSRDSRWRAVAAAAIANLGEQTLPAVVALLKSPDGNVRYYAVNILRHMGDQAVPYLVESLHDADWRVRCAAAIILGEQGAVVSMPELIPCATDQEPRVRFAAELAILHIGHPGIPALLVALQSQQATLRRQAAYLLGALTPPAESAIPALTSVLQDQAPEVCAAAREAVAKIKGEK